MFAPQRQFIPGNVRIHQRVDRADNRLVHQVTVHLAVQNNRTIFLRNVEGLFQVFFEFLLAAAVNPGAALPKGLGHFIELLVDELQKCNEAIVLVGK